MKIGTLSIDSFKVGSQDCRIYLGETLLYPEETIPSYPYAMYRKLRSGTEYTIECDSTSSNTITSANTRNSLTNTAVSGTASGTSNPVEIVFGDCCTSISANACKSWRWLEKLTIGSGVTTLNNTNLFYGCVRVSDLEIGRNVTEIKGTQQFHTVGQSATTKPTLDLSRNTGIAISGSPFYNAHFKDIKLPSGSQIYSQAFYGVSADTLSFGAGSVINGASSSVSGAFSLTNIGRIDLSNVTYIGNYSFSRSSGYTDITIPSVDSLGYGSFSSAHTLTSVTLDYDGTTPVSSNVFSSGTSIQRISIGSNVGRLGNYMFAQCTSLANVTIPDNVTEIGTGAFSGCTSLESITLPASLTVVEGYLLSSDRSLTSLTVPASVTEIGIGAFSGCTSLGEIVMLPTTPPGLNYTSSLSNTNSCPIYVPDASVSAYKAADGWSTFSSRIYGISEKT